MSKQIVLTYDYELFLGSDSGDLNQTLIKPTEKILKILEQYNAVGLFFIDVTFLSHIKNTKCYDSVKRQIQKIRVLGHEIGLHLHPHWIDAKEIKKCRWKFENFENFRLHSFDNQKLEQIVRENYNLLQSIIYEIDSRYKIECFRAGGWSVQPFEQLKDIFLEVGIKYDFSVLPGMLDDDRPKHYYNFKNTPQKEIWYFTDDILCEDTNGKFLEVPTTVFKMNIFDLIKNKRLIKTYKIAGNGYGAGKQKSFLEKLQRVRLYVPQILSSDSLEYEIFKKYISKIDKNLVIYVAHPKLFSENSFKILVYLCKNFKIITYKDISN